MAKNSCVIITPDLKERFCEADNISENDLGLFLYDYLESKHTPNELSNEVLNSDSFKEWYNWHFKLGNSRFRISTPIVYKRNNQMWKNMQTYGMDAEGYLTIDTVEKQKVLNWIKQDRDFEGHYVIYTDLDGNVVLKVEKPVYSGIQYSKSSMKMLNNNTLTSKEDIQEYLKERNIIHRFKGKWRITKTKDGFNKLQELINNNTIHKDVVKTYSEGDTVVVTFEDLDYNDNSLNVEEDTIDNVIPVFDLDVIKADSKEMEGIIKNVIKFNSMRNLHSSPKITSKINSYKVGDSAKVIDVLTNIVNDPNLPKQHRLLATTLIPLLKDTTLNIEFVDYNDISSSGRVTIGAKTRVVKSFKINVQSELYKNNPSELFLHELTHVLSSIAVYTSKILRKSLNSLMQVVKEYMKTTDVPEEALYVANGKEYNIPYHLYGLYNEREFLAEAFANPDFQELLRNIPISEEEVNKNAWSSFVNWVKDSLQFLFKQNYNKTTSVYDALVPILSDVIVKTASLKDDILTTPNLAEDNWEMFTSQSENIAIKELAEILLIRDAEESAVDSSKNNPSPVNEFEVGDRLYGEIRRVFAERVAYSQNFKKDHVYLVKNNKGEWVPADYTVTQLVEKPFDKDNPFGPVSKGLGNTNDEFMRDFFAHNLKPSYPNLTQEQYEELKRGANEIIKYLDSILGAGNYKVGSQEFPILGYTTVNGETKTVAGTMDLIVYDKEGNFYIIDMKTRRVGDNGTPDMSDRLEGYSKQQYMYKNMLEMAIPELVGKIQKPLLLVSTVKYPSPKNGYTYNLNKKGTVTATYTDVNGLRITKPITMIPGYQAPQYYNFMSTKDVDAEIKEMLTMMSPEEFEIEYGTPEIVKKSLEERREIVLNTAQSKLASETEALYTLLPKEEITFLGNKIASLFTKYVDLLLTRPEANAGFFTNRRTGVNPYSKYDFTKMSREELLDVPFLVENILNHIKEFTFNINHPNNASKPDNIKTKLMAAYVNFDALVKTNYTEFIKLEGLTFNKSTAKTHFQDGVDETIINTNDPSENENNGHEHWQIGIRNMSAMSGLSAQLRRFLSTIENIDSNGKVIADRYGYGLSTTINGKEIVNSLLMWLKDCNTLEEMEQVLQRLVKTRPWIQNLLDKIKNEPIRSQFFQCFRKDFTEYSVIVTVKKTDPYTGLPYWETINKVINTVGAVDKVLSEVKDAYFNRDIAIFSNGLLNIKKVETIQSEISKIQTYYNNTSNWESLKKNISKEPNLIKLKGLLNDLGIMFDDAILADLVASDEEVVSFAGSKLNKIIVQTKYITSNLLEGNKKESYDPLGKGEEYSVYHSYKNIATIAEPYVVTALEASTYANGKMYYSFVSPSYTGQLINNLVNTDKQSLADFLEENYGKYEWFKTNDDWNIQWLKDIEHNRDVIARKVQLSFEEVDYVDLSERAYALSLLREFFYDQHNKSLAWYRVPILSNKPSSEFIRNKRYSGDFKKELRYQLCQIFLQEVKRMQTVLDRCISPTITDADKIKNYDIKFSKNSEINKAQKKVIEKVKNKEVVTREDLIVDGNYIFEDSGVSFKFLDGFVEDIKIESLTGQYIIDKVFNRGVVTVDGKKIIPVVKNRIEEIMVQKVEATKKHFMEIGLIGKDLNFMLQGDRIDDSTTIEEALEKLTPAIEEYVWNDFVATANIIQLTTTDLAFYSNSVDFQKRFAQVHSPGLRLNKTATNVINGKKVKVSDGYLRSMLIADKISSSEIKENVRKALNDHYESMEEGNSKKEFKVMMDMIVSQFDRINEADAQAFTCPTAYMKKMVMAGEWNPLMQEAYERIKSGNYNVNDLGVVWQPIKPFVYTQNEALGHSSTSKFIKVPSQHKNSEYLLIIADALTRGNKQNNMLNTLMEFMESTHKGPNGEYKQDGIDTIEFDSAVKVGVHGVIDINNISTTEARQKLEEALKNEANIFKYPVEDYAIQQNVPDHFNDHTQPMGSQIRALVLSDLTGTSYTPLGKDKGYTPKEVNKVYQDLIAKNVYRSWEDLKKDLGLTGNRYDTNKQLSEILQEEMSKDARYGADLRRAVMLDANGEFIVPLDDPIHSSRIQQLINSIVKSRINKQRTKGGPVVQASSFGLSEELNIIFQTKDGKELLTITQYGKKHKLEGKELEIAYKKYVEDNQGVIKHFECYVPLPSGMFEELMLVDDGKGGKRILNIEEATNPNSEYYVKGLRHCLNAIGYRIPTEDTYSMVPIKIKGFVPKAAGEVVMLPKEITLLSGSDKSMFKPL